MRTVSGLWPMCHSEWKPVHKIHTFHTLCIQFMAGSLCVCVGRGGDGGGGGGAIVLPRATKSVESWYRWS